MIFPQNADPEPPLAQWMRQPGLNRRGGRRCLPSPARTQFDCLDLGYFASLHGESQQGAHEMPSVVTASTGVHMKQSEHLVAHDLQDMRVAADEQTGSQTSKFHPCSPVVIAWVAPYVGHVNVDALALPGEIGRQIGAEFGTVKIPVNASDWPKGPEQIQNLDRPEVACVPNLVAFGEMPENSVVQKSVCVGEQPDSHSPAYALPIFRQMRQAIIG
jgi:hypothetical protein